MMPTFQTLEQNKIQYVTIPQQPMMPAPVMFMPQMVPAPIPFQPAPLPALPMLPMTNQTMPATSAPLFYDGSSFTSLPSNLQSLDNNGFMIPPPGYSFVTMDVPSPSTERTVGSGSVEPELELLSLPSSDTIRSRSSSVVSTTEEKAEVPVVETPTKTKPQNKKFKHRSKQTRILEVHAKLKEEYTAKGLYAGDDEVLRGFDTVRVHVKTYKALNRIECPLNDVEKHPQVTVEKIATPFSMKNRFQKKGFIVYLKLASPDMVPIVQEIFSHYKEDFAKCDVALKKEDKLAQDRARAEKSLAMNDISSSLTDQSSCDFLSARAYSREGFEFSDWSRNGMAA